MKRIVRFLTLMFITGFFGSMYCPNCQGAIFKKWFGKNEKSAIDEREDRMKATHFKDLKESMKLQRGDIEESRFKRIEDFLQDKIRHYEKTNPALVDQIKAYPFEYFKKPEDFEVKAKQAQDVKKDALGDRLFEGRTADKSAAEMKEIVKRAGEKSWEAEHQAPSRPTKPAPFEKPKLSNTAEDLEQKKISKKSASEVDIADKYQIKREDDQDTKNLKIRINRMMQELEDLKNDSQSAIDMQKSSLNKEIESSKKIKWLNDNQKKVLKAKRDLLKQLEKNPKSAIEEQKVILKDRIEKLDIELAEQTKKQQKKSIEPVDEALPVPGAHNLDVFD